MAPRLFSNARAASSAKRAFTLVELLVVMAVIIILLGLTGRAVRSLTEASDISQGGQIVADQINSARQFASARNCTVEVRLFKLGDSSPGYGAIQLWRTVSQSPAGTVGYKSVMVPAGKVVKLAQSVAVSENASLSRLLSLLPQAAKMSEAGTMNGFNYVAFQIKPDGSVLPVYNGNGTGTSTGGSGTGSIMSSAYLTVLPARFAGSTPPAVAPRNYVTVQANPYTGTSLLYAP